MLGPTEVVNCPESLLDAGCGKLNRNNVEEIALKCADAAICMRLVKSQALAAIEGVVDAN